MPTAHIVITKEFTFRGKPERFSNGYNLQTGSNAITHDYVRDLADALVSMERNFHRPEVKFVYEVGGALGEDAVYTNERATPLAGTTGGPLGDHPETCHMVESKIGPKRYLRKYYHTLVAAGTPGTDVVGTFGGSSINTATIQLTNGTLPGNAVACRPNGALATAPFTCDPYKRVHQLKRRGKRP